MDNQLCSEAACTHCTAGQRAEIPDRAAVVAVTKVVEGGDVYNQGK